MRKIVFIILLFIITGSSFIGCSKDVHTDDDAYNKVFSRGYHIVMHCL